MTSGVKPAAARPTPNDRIVIVGMNYAPEVAGVGRYTGQIGAHLAAQGHELCVVTTPPHYPGWSARSGFSAKRWTRDESGRATIYRCPLYLHPEMAGVRRLLAPLSFALSSAPVALWQILRRRPRVVLVVEPTLFVAPVALLAARLVGARTVLHVQDLEVDAAFAVGHLAGQGSIARLARWFDRDITRRFDQVITISARMRERLVAKGVTPRRIAVVRNWVDLNQIRPLDKPSPYRVDLALPDDTFVVLYSGNIGAKQGIGLILEAADRLRLNSRIVFIVAGEGPSAPAVETAARTLPNLRRLPFQPEERFGDFLGLADLHLLPQERGAADLVLPSKLGGLLASGKPILATADRGTELADFLGESCTFVAPGDSAALSEAIGLLSTAPADPGAMGVRLALAQQLDKVRGMADFAGAMIGDSVHARRGSGSPSKGHGGYQHPHVRMARERRRRLLARRFAFFALVVLLTVVSASSALFLGS